MTIPTTNAPEINKDGNAITRGFIQNGDRYLFDFRLCSDDDGWQQFTTDQDDWYFGVWLHPERLETVCYIEGDVVHVKCESPEQYAKEIKALCACYRPAPEFVTIDPDAGVRTEYFQDRAALLLTPKI